MIEYPLLIIVKQFNVAFKDDQTCIINGRKLSFNKTMIHFKMLVTFLLTIKDNLANIIQV